MNRKRMRRAVLFIAIVVLLFSRRTGATTPGDVAKAYEDYEKFYFQTANAKIEVQLLEHGVARVEVFAPEINSKYETYMTVTGALRKARLDQNSGANEVFSPQMRVRYTTSPFSLEFADAAGKTLLRLAPDGIAWQPDGSYIVTFIKETGDRFFGLGEPLPGIIGEPIRIEYKGRSRAIWNRHVPPSDLGLPFFINPRGYALFFENPYKADFDFRGETFSYAATGGPLRFYVFTEKNVYDILDVYSQLTGRAPMPPRWVTGYLQSKFGYRNVEEGRAVMDGFRSRKIPCDTIIYDLYWFDENMGDLAWGKNNFPNAPEFMKEMERRGFKTIVIIEPYIMGRSANQKKVFQSKLAATRAKGGQYLFTFWGQPMSLLLDFMLPETQKWFADRVKEIHDTGVDAWWTDLNEPETEPDGMYFGGLPSAAGHNLQALLMHKGMWEMYRREFPDERLFIMTRSGFTGDWRYGAGIWSGDVQSSWGHLADQTPIGISAGLSGYGMWNSDIGGFHGHPTPELFTRWMQFGAFCPVFRAHGAHDPREPWSYGEEAEKNIRKVFDLRYRLSPYLYTLFHEMHTYGRPPMRAMFLEFPEDEKAYGVINQFMYGAWLLVAPAVKVGATSRTVYLPAGEWTNFWTEETVKGPAMVKADAPLDRIPLFVRDGAIVPMSPPMQYTSEKPVDPLTLHVYPGGGPTTYTVYEDDGATNRYENGEYALTEVTVRPGTQGAEIVVDNREGRYEGMPKTRSYVVVIHHAGWTDVVSVNGKHTAQVKGDVETDAPKSAAWSYDKERNLVKIFVSTRASGFTATTRVYEKK